MRLGGTQDRVGIEPAFTQRSVVGQDALDLLPQEAARALAHGVERPPQVEDLRESLAPVAGKRASERARLQQASLENHGIVDRRRVAHPAPSK